MLNKKNTLKIKDVTTHCMQLTNPQKSNNLECASAVCPTSGYSATKYIPAFFYTCAQTHIHKPYKLCSFREERTASLHSLMLYTIHSCVTPVFTLRLL